MVSRRIYVRKAHGSRDHVFPSSLPPTPLKVNDDLPPIPTMASGYGAIPTAAIASQQQDQPTADQPGLPSSRWPLLLRPRPPTSKRSAQLGLALLILITAGALLWLQNELFDSIKRPLPILSDEYHHVQLDISHLFNNIAAGPNADFDPHYHSAFAAEHLPTDEFMYDGVKVRVIFTSARNVFLTCCGPWRCSSRCPATGPTARPTTSSHAARPFI